MPHLPARTGRAMPLNEGELLVVTNTHGSQVVDTWAFSKADSTRQLSAPHTWMRHGRLSVQTGDLLLDTTRSPMLRLDGGTYAGPHDLLIPSCDIHRYRELGVEGYHDNCRDSFGEAVAGLGIAPPEVTPQPLNLFMNVPVRAGGAFHIQDPVAVPGDTVTLRALQDVIIVLSACPQDLAPTNGVGRTPTGVDYDIQS